MHTSTAFLWSIPSHNGTPNDSLLKKPSQSEKSGVSCFNSETPLVKKEKRKGYILTTPDFAERAERARTKAMESPQQWKSLTFKEVVPKWLEHRTMYVKPSTIHCYSDYIARLNKFFADIVLENIHIGHLQEYQRAYKSTYHPASINHDLNTLSQMLSKAGLWLPIAEHYRTLPTPRRPKPRVLTVKQEDEFFEFAASDMTWFLAYWEASLSNNTTAYGVELRLMQLSDVDMQADPPTITVPLDVKNDHRPRVIPLNERGKKMMERILARASSLGSTRPETYLFPFRIKRNLYDPTRPASPSWTNGQWRKLVAAALEKKIIPFRISRRNFRNQPITKMLEAGVPIETVRGIAGHVSDEMTRYYDQHRISVRASALDLIDPDRKKPAAFSTPKKGRGVSA